MDVAVDCGQSLHLDRSRTSLMKRRIRFEAGYEGGGRGFELRLTTPLSQPCIVHLVRITLLRCVRTKNLSEA